MRLTLKAKILTTIISLSVIGLTVFGYLSFKTYQDDKMAFVYDYLTAETTSRSKLFTMASEDYEILLSSIISKIDLKNRGESDSVIGFLEGDQKRITGLYYHVPVEESLNQVTMFEASNDRTWSWESIHAAPFGLSLLDRKSGNFVFKKVIGQDKAYAAIVFKQFDLLNMLSSTSDRFNFILAKNKIMSKNQVELDPATVADLKQQISEAPGLSGLLNVTLGDIPYFVSFSRLGSDEMLLVNMIPEHKVLLVQQTFLHQVVSFLILMASVSLLIGTLSSRWLTWNIDKLTHAAREIENENFDVQVDIHTKDELETLGTAFNNMNYKIRNLLEELRNYARELEDKVKERTKELQHLTDIQKGMLNALGQGFVIVDKEHKVLPVYSKVAEDMFEVVPNEVEPYSIMGVDQEQGNTFKEFFEMVFNDMIPFDDMTRIAPDMRSNHKNQKIQLSYAPITSGEDDGQKFEYVLIVGTDKTVEFENMEKFKKEWTYSQMISKIAGNRFAFIKILSESMNMLRKSTEALDSGEEYAVRTVQRLVHTIKGSFSYFYIQDLTEKCHALESSLEPHYNVKDCTEELKLHVMNEIYTIQEYLEDFISKNDSIIQYKDAAKNRSVAFDDMVQFSAMLEKRDPTLRDLFAERFFTSPVGLFFQMYPSIVKELGTKLNKEVRFTMIGGDVKIPDGPWEEIFANFIHFIRNSVDHGIEFPDARESAGKTPFGTITFQFNMAETPAGKVLRVNLKDDGGGIHWEKLAAKDPTVKSHQDAIERIKTGGISSKDTVSDISGRGVGVSSLFSAVADYGGKADMESVPGKGTMLTIELPLKSGKSGLKLAA
jgi:two-component system chemotaxis sensor kinase CheA